MYLYMNFSSLPESALVLGLFSLHLQNIRVIWCEVNERYTQQLGRAHIII